MKRLALATLIVFFSSMAAAFYGSFGGERSEELLDVIRVSDTFIAVGFSEHYEEPYIETLAIKLDLDGGVLWTKEFGSMGDDLGRCVVAIDDNHYFLVSRTESAGNAKLLIAMINGEGDLIWQKNHGKNSDYSPWSVINTGDGFVVAGQCATDRNYFQASLLKIETSGKIVWEKDFGKNDFDAAIDVILLSDGKLLVTGYSWVEDHQYLWLAKLDSTGRLIWQKLLGKKDGLHLEGRGLAEVENGYLVAGVASDFSGLAYIAKVDPSGELLNEVFLDDKFPAVLALAKDNESYVALLSFVTVAEEGFGLVRINEDGEIIQEKVFKVGSFEPHSFARLDSGKFFVVGTRSNDSKGRQAYWTSAEF